MNYFTPKELQCQHSGEDGIEASFLEKLNAIRQECDFPFIVHLNTPLKLKKKSLGHIRQVEP